jgi:hypothetical protein
VIKLFDMNKIMTQANVTMGEMMTIMEEVQEEIKDMKIGGDDVITLVLDVAKARSEPVQHILCELYAMLLTQKKMYLKKS